MKIKKRWFRNWYIVEFGKGYSIKYSCVYWTMARRYAKGGIKVIEGPYLKSVAAERTKRLSDEMYYNTNTNKLPLTLSNY